jgi:ribonucleoside-diphosphate reductase alpha chain
MQVLNIGKADDKETKQAPALSQDTIRVAPRPRPDITTGFTEKVKIGCGNLYITVNYDEQGICEVFTNTGKAGGCPSQSEATSRLISVALRSGLDVNALVSQLKGIRCPSTIRQRDLHVLSCPDAIARVMETVFKLQNGHDKTLDPIIKPLSKVCPECGKEVEHEGGCVICRNCGYSKCG